LTIIFALIAGLTTLYQYLESVEDNRRKETLKYIDRSQDVRVGPARNKIAEILLDNDIRHQYDAAWKAAIATPPNEDPLDDFVKQHNLRGNLIVIIEHYMNLSGCVSAQICDKELACQFFKGDIEALNNGFRPLFESVWKKRDGQNYMAGPMDFVKSCSPKRGWFPL